MFCGFNVGKQKYILHDGTMAAEDIHVRLCLQDIIKLDLEAKAIIQVLRDNSSNVFLACFLLWECYQESHV
jgi:hypothetical protein